METVKFKNPVIMDVKTLIMDRVSRGTDCLVTVVCHWTWGDTWGTKGDMMGRGDKTWEHKLSVGCFSGHLPNKPSPMID